MQNSTGAPSRCAIWQMNIVVSIALRWLLAIGKASLFGAGLDIGMSRQLKTKTQKSIGMKV